MATTKEIMDYVMNSPENTNPAILKELLNEHGGAGSGVLPEWKIISVDEESGFMHWEPGFDGPRPYTFDELLNDYNRYGEKILVELPAVVEGYECYKPLMYHEYAGRFLAGGLCLTNVNSDSNSDYYAYLTSIVVYLHSDNSFNCTVHYYKLSGITPDN